MLGLMQTSGELNSAPTGTLIVLPDNETLAQKTMDGGWEIHGEPDEVPSRRLAKPCVILRYGADYHVTIDELDSVEYHRESRLEAAQRCAPNHPAIRGRAFSVASCPPKRRRTWPSWTVSLAITITYWIVGMMAMRVADPGGFTVLAVTSLLIIFSFAQLVWFVPRAIQKFKNALPTLP